MSRPLLWALCIAGAYLAGSIPFGLLIGRLRGIDIRQHGSRNIGATNVGRVLGRPWGMLCFFLDMAKGALPVLIAGWLTGILGRRDIAAADAWLWLGVIGAAIAGHMFPVFIGFRGGKGVATGFGALLGAWPVLTVPALAALFVWVIALRITRYVSVSSCIAAIALPLTVAGWAAAGAWGDDSGHAWLEHSWPFLAGTAALAAVVIWKHRANFARLRAGTEFKVGAKRPPDNAAEPGDASSP